MFVVFSFSVFWKGKEGSHYTLQNPPLVVSLRVATAEWNGKLFPPPVVIGLGRVLGSRRFLNDVRYGSLSPFATTMDPQQGLEASPVRSGILLDASGSAPLEKEAEPPGDSPFRLSESPGRALSRR